MSRGRPRFALPLAADRIRWAPPPPPVFELLESVVEAAPMDLPPGPVVGEGVGAKEVERKVVQPRGAREEGDLVAKEKKLTTKPHREVAALPPVETLDIEEEPTAVEAKEAKEVVKEDVGEPTSALKALENRLRPLMDKNTTSVKPALYIPSNRRAFKQFIIQAFWRYKLPAVPDIPDPDACAKAAAASKSEVKTFNYQAFVRDYIRRPSPYRGILVYHGLGSGKTCTSIAAMEGLYNAGQKPVYIFTPASLSKNYRDEITKCGPFIFRTNNYWSWISVPNMSKPSPEAEFLVKVLGIPPPVVRKQKGAWAPDPSKAPNFDTLTTPQRQQIQNQIYAHIDHRFQFIHYNGLLEKTVRQWACEDPHKFDGATVVIDEVHNLIRTINNSALDVFYKDEPREMAEYSPKFCAVGKKYRISYLLYRMLCNSVGCKIIALSGTPLINYPHEIAILANLLAGDTRMAEATLPGFEMSSQVLKRLEVNPEVDFVEVVPRPDVNASMVRYTPVPSGCRKVIDPATQAFRGFVRDSKLVAEEGEMARERNLPAWFERTAQGTAMRDVKFSSVPRLPDLEKPFRELFIDTEKLEVKPETRLALMARLSGLISYYKGGKADLMAKVTTDEVVMLDMSDRQLSEYTAMRKEEIDKEQRERKKKKPAVGVAVVQGPTLYDQVTKGQNSTFKIFSRAACNFAFPPDLERPRPADFRDAVFDLGAAKEEGEDVGDTEEPVAPALGAVDEEGPVPPGYKRLFGKLVKMSDYEMAILNAQQSLRSRGEAVFGPEALRRLSPKYQAMIDRMDASRGSILVYSQFKKLEGIGLFAMALEVQKGYRKFDIVQTPGGGWDLAPETRDAGPGTPRYITYTGDETLEKRNILKAVFNAAWGKMPEGLAAQVKALTGATHNQKGEIARVFMITQSGAEGISLSNVRQVHIMEPYWNYVRLEQVKGRAIRICSHMDLPPEERTVDVYTYIVKFSDRQLRERLVDETLLNFDGGVTTDQNVLTLSNAKKKLSDSLFRVMQESAVDCELNATENGAMACYRFAGEPTMEPLFHPLVNVHLANAAAVRARA